MEKILDIIQTELFGIAVWVYVASFGALLIGFAAKKITSVVLNRLKKAANKTRMVFDDIILDSLAKPLEWATVMGGIYLAILILPIPKEPVDIERFVRSLLTGASVVLVIWFAIRLVDGLAEVWAKKAELTDTKLDDQLVPIVRRSLKVFLILIGIVLVLQNLGYSVGSLLAGLGIGGVAVAMAAKDTIANLFGSLVVFMDKPFQIGDWIEMDEVEGTVEEVGLRTTRVRTFANSLITIPNLKFTTSAINNWSRMKKRRIKMTIGVTYDSPPKQINELVIRIRKIIEEDRNIRNDFYLVNFDNFGSSSLDVFIYCFTETTVWAEFLQAKQEFLLKLMACVNEMGLEFAFPTQTLHLEGLKDAPEGLTGQRPR